MALTEARKKLRGSHIGASEMAAVLGQDPWKSAYDVWLEKTGQLEDEDKGSVAMQTGIILEPSVLKEAEIYLGPLLRNQRRIVTGLPIAATLDAMRRDGGEPVEAKTAGIHGPLQEWWGEAGTDHIPDRYIIQVHVQMMAVEAKHAYVPALIGDGNGFRIFEVDFKEDLALYIAQAAEFFWGCVESGEAPEDSVASLEVVKKMIRKPGKTTIIKPDLFVEWEAAKETVKIAKKIKDEATAKILAELGDAEGATIEGHGAVTYLEYDRKEYVSKATKYRSLKHKKNGL